MIFARLHAFKSTFHKEVTGIRNSFKAGVAVLALVLAAGANGQGLSKKPIVPIQLPTAFGPQMHSVYQGRDLLAKRPSIRFMQWNVENHFPAKPAKSLTAMSMLINTIFPDLLMVQEVDTLQTMQTFQYDFLKDQYRVLLIDGNDERGIDSGLYIRKDSPLSVVLVSYKDLTDKDGVVFRRDAATFILVNPATNTPLLAVVGVHLKSMRDSIGDRKGTIQREREARTLTVVYEELKKTYGKDFPVLISGDFNNEVSTAPEFDSIRQAGFIDSLELVGYKLPRYTHFYFTRPPESRRHFLQLDATFFDPSAQALNFLTKSEVVLQMDDQGKVVGDPKSFAERKSPSRPSDHKATVMEWDTAKLIH